VLVASTAPTALTTTTHAKLLLALATLVLLLMLQTTQHALVVIATVLEHVYLDVSLLETATTQVFQCAHT
jgi:hypothetical protein